MLVTSLASCAANPWGRGAVFVPPGYSVTNSAGLRGAQIDYAQGLGRELGSGNVRSGLGRAGTDIVSSLIRGVVTVLIAPPSY